MTGLVKEEILARRGELGVRITGGRLHFQPLFLRRREFFTTDADFTYFDVWGNEKKIELQPGCLAFTICQVPIVYRLGQAPVLITVTHANGQHVTVEQNFLDREVSLKMFQRTSEIERIVVQLPEEQILRA